MTLLKFDIFIATQILREIQFWQISNSPKLSFLAILETLNFEFLVNLELQNCSNLLKLWQKASFEDGKKANEAEVKKWRTIKISNLQSFFHTVWIFKNFSATQILREINFSQFQRPQNCYLTAFDVSEIVKITEIDFT